MSAMAKVLNIKNETDKRELKGLLDQVDITAWEEPGDSPLAKFEEKGRKYRDKFVEKKHIINEDEAVLYEICNVLKKKRIKIDEETYWLTHIASNIIITLSARANSCADNDFSNKVRIIWKEPDEKKYRFLVKNSKYWFGEIQEALASDNYDLLSNSMVLMMFLRKYVAHIWCNKK